MFFRKAILLFFIFLFGINLIFHNSESILSELLLIRQRFIIEKKDATIQFKFSTKTWKSIKDGNEFYWNNSYYDVKKTVFNKAHITVYAIKDCNENFFKYCINSITNKSKSDSTKETNKLKRNFDLTLDPIIQQENIIAFLIKKKRLFSLLEIKDFSIIRSLIKPPII